jgi:hypothetical protein
MALPATEGVVTIVVPRLWKKTNMVNAAAIVLLLASLWISITNWRCVVVAITRQQHVSWVPLFGGILGTAGCLMTTNATLNSLWWLPLLVDWGCVPGFTHCAIAWTMIAVRNRWF